jgi:phosphoribosylaminoimidazole-succinocarboxamide synthase
MISVVDHRTQSYANFISDSRDGVLRSVTSLTISDHQIHPRASGKVRDVFEYDDHLIIVTTDRQSAFDRNIADVPFKGKSLNMLSGWWFSKTARIIPSAFIASPHPNVTIARKCKVFPVEFVVRGYITGSTATSIWMNYANGVRNYCGHVLPEGLRKHQKLDQVIITPTTKSSEHDALTSAQDLIAQGVMTQAQWDICAHHALTLFQLGQEICADRGLILVDTKYEFGVDVKTGLVRLVDEVHTPDSSRFWIAGSYESRMAAGEVRAIETFNRALASCAGCFTECVPQLLCCIT